MEHAPTASRQHPASPWQPLSYADVLHTPDTFGVAVIGNASQEPLLVAAGVIREELWRLVNDPLARIHGASFFRFYVTLAHQEADRLADELLRVTESEEGRRLFWRHFPAPD